MINYFSFLTSIYPARIWHKENFTKNSLQLHEVHFGPRFTVGFTFLPSTILQTISNKTQINALMFSRGVFDDPLKNP